VAFEYRPTGDTTTTTTATQTLSATGSFSADVSGLTAGTEYEVRATATASDGDTGTGSWVTFTTATADTSVAVATESASAVGETTATLAGTLDDLGGASSAEVAFEWGEAGAGFPNTTPGETLSATGSFDASLSGLSSGTDYEFRAVADASDGDTDTGTAASFTTDSEPVGDTAPSVDSYVAEEAGSPNPHAEITARWTVSDTDGDLEGVTVAVETVADAPDVPAETTSATPADLVAVASADHSTDEPAVESTDGPVRGSTEEPTVDSTESEILGWAFARVDSPVRVEECVRPLAFKGAYLWGLFVEPRARSRGVGAALAGALTDAVARDRYGSAFALVDRSNARSRRVFERVGYRCVDETVRVTVGGRRPPTGVVLGARTYANTD